MILGKLRSQTSVIRAMGYADFIRGFGRYPTWILLVIYLSSIRNMSFIEIGAIFFVQSIISFPINIAGGRFIDRVGRRSISLFLPLALVIIYFLLFISVLYNGNIWFIIVEFVSTGILSSVQWVVINAIITDNSTLSGRLDAFTVLRILGNAGIGVGLVLSGVFAIFQPALFFVVPAGGSIVEFFIFMKYVPESKPSFAVDNHESRRKIKVYRDGLLIIITVIMATSALFANQWETPTLPLYLTRFLSIPEEFITILYAINTVTVIMFQYRLNIIAEKIGYVRSFSLGLILYAMSFIVFGLTGNIIILALNVVLLTLGESLANPFFSVTISRIAPADKRGEYFGFSSAISGIIGTFSPFVGTLFLTIFFRIPIDMWLSFSLITLFMAFVALLTRSKILDREEKIKAGTP